MAHYAFLDANNIVTEVITGRDEDDLAEGVTSWEDYYGALRGQRCLRTSYNTYNNEHVNGGAPFRGNFAGIGSEYRDDLDAFVPAKPGPNFELGVEDWVLNEGTLSWEPAGA